MGICGDFPEEEVLFDDQPQLNPDAVQMSSPHPNMSSSPQGFDSEIHVSGCYQSCSVLPWTSEPVTAQDKVNPKKVKAHPYHQDVEEVRAYHLQRAKEDTQVWC